MSILVLWTTNYEGGFQTLKSTRYLGLHRYCLSHLKTIKKKSLGLLVTADREHYSLSYWQTWPAPHNPSGHSLEREQTIAHYTI